MHGVADGRQSRNNVIQKIEKTLNNIHTTTQTRTNNGYTHLKIHNLFAYQHWEIVHP